MQLKHLWANTYGLTLKSDQGIEEVKLCLQDTRLKKGDLIRARLITDAHSQCLDHSLSGLGFQKKGDRIEYRQLIKDLPKHMESPLDWKSVEELNWSRKEVAYFLQDVALHDPGHDPKQDALKFVEDFYYDPELTCGEKCIHIGFMQGIPCALTVVQMDLKDGWCRISYMGILPKFRGKGLGRWVHLYSFQRMRELGGKTYHGGTFAQNYPMLRLFNTYCKPHRKMEEWEYRC